MVDIWWYGQACFKLRGKNVSLVFDPYDPDFCGLAEPKLEADIICITHDHQDHNNVAQVKPASPNLGGPLEGQESPFVIFGPGEYEKSGASIVGIASYHDNQEGKARGQNTIYQVTIDEVNIVHLGDLGQKKLTQEQVEALAACDILLIPVGGVYTINAKEAPDIIAQIEPKIIVPMHYKLANLKFDLVEVSEFLSVMGKEGLQPQSKLSVSRERLPTEPEVVVLEKQ